MSKKEILNKKLIDCNLSTRAQTCLSIIKVQYNFIILNEHGEKKMDTIGDLVSCKKSDLMRMRNLGLKTISEFENLIASFGIDWN